jgi:hypothetical protein
MIDDPHDARIGGDLDWMEWETRFFTSHKEHGFANTRANRIDSNERSARRFTVGIQGLEQHQLDPVQVFVFHRRDDIADDFGDLHGLTDPL